MKDNRSNLHDEGDYSRCEHIYLKYGTLHQCSQSAVGMVENVGSEDEEDSYESQVEFLCAHHLPESHPKANKLYHATRDEQKRKDFMAYLREQVRMDNLKKYGIN